MIKIGLRAEQTKFSKREFNRDLDLAIIEVIKGAAHAMLEEMLSRIPVYRGMAQASLSAFARAVNYEGNIPAQSPKKGTTTRPSKFYPTGKGIAQGDAAGGATFTVSQRKGRGLTYNISFSTNVPHFQFMDEKRPNNPLAPSSAPWRSVSAGRRAFENYLKGNLPKKIPNLSKYLKTYKRATKFDE